MLLELKGKWPTESDVKSATMYWQRTLRLMDWDVIVKYASPGEFVNERVLGECWRNSPRKHAKILLLNPIYYEGDEKYNWMPYDVEATIVHELIHLHAWFLEGEAGTIELKIEEQMVECLATAFVSLYRVIKLGD